MEDNWKIKFARAYAIQAHGDQKYGVDKPYSYHLDAVYDISRHYFSSLLKEYQDDDIFIIAYLHDILEDTDVTYTDLENVFRTSSIAMAVYALTDEPGKNRKIRKLNTWHKIRANYRATYIKLCDRLANTLEPGKIDMYRKEFPVFQAALYVPGQFTKLWEDLEKATYGT